MEAEEALNLARKYFDHKDFAHAKDCFLLYLKAIKSEGAKPGVLRETYMMLARTCMELEEPDSARNWLAIAKKRRMMHCDAMAFISIAQLEIDLGFHSEAVEDLNMAETILHD
ncbi:MAG: hypothetical protein ACRD3W_03865, partial [Terriglobales bacterium]